MQDNLTGLIVGAPYLCCAIIGCWLTEPLNRRRGIIFISCLIAAIVSVWERAASSWANPFIARFVPGFGIGTESSAVPVYDAECVPAPIRGALVMQWQMWTAFGTMLGNTMGVYFYGVNIIAYYSTTTFIESGYSTNSALLASMGTGILNWVFALPALFTIDKWGRRNLLLFTFPWFSVFLLWTGLAFYANSDKAKVGLVTTGMYLFEVFNSAGEGPVPFTYSAEAFPVHVRDVGMSWAATWCFNFVISMTWPRLRSNFTPTGAFGWCAAWCAVLLFLILLFVPEIKALTLEELDQVFGVSTRKHTRYQIKHAVWHFRKWVLRQDLEPPPSFTPSLRSWIRHSR
ncbi:hypothetical protein N0V84_010205 [Fusarium piperis]|uniref:Major facilitator superfamily (MFS) profile domain-containing protein n=1 Tax=Fusarium piperis TaxID=1435070 RepID=A0A9W8W4U3_9HYPO|nr:hypothetical protein N0V84_010205 [Fusarium piperis]